MKLLSLPVNGAVKVTHTHCLKKTSFGLVLCDLHVLFVKVVFSESCFVFEILRFEIQLVLDPCPVFDICLPFAFSAVCKEHLNTSFQC